MRLIHYSKLKELPPVEWLIKDYIPAGSLVMLWARQESFKSFVALSWACSVATGKPWLGSVPIGDPGPVVYIAAEGQRGILPRAKAWTMKYYGGQDLNHFWTIPEPVTVDEVPQMIEYIERARIIPRLVVVDTYSRCLAGESENDAPTAERFLKAVDELRHKYDATVLIVHHCDKVGQWPRGSYALQCAMEAIYQVQREEGSAVCNLIPRKMKDSDRPASMTLIARKVGDSLVMERA
jgi:putative DNA primase/helicase